MYVVGFTRPGPAGWAMVSLGCALLAVVVAGGRLHRLAGLVAVADVLWCLATVVVKQGVVLHDLGERPGNWSALLTVAGLSLLLMPALLLLPPLVRAWCCWVVAVVGTVVLYADLVYGRFFGDVLSVAHNATEVRTW